MITRYYSKYSEQYDIIKSYEDYIFDKCDEYGLSSVPDMVAGILYFKPIPIKPASAETILSQIKDFVQHAKYSDGLEGDINWVDIMNLFSKEKREFDPSIIIMDIDKLIADEDPTISSINDHCLLRISPLPAFVRIANIDNLIIYNGYLIGSTGSNMDPAKLAGPLWDIYSYVRGQMQIDPIGVEPNWPSEYKILVDPSTIKNVTISLDVVGNADTSFPTWDESLLPATPASKTGKAGYLIDITDWADLNWPNFINGRSHMKLKNNYFIGGDTPEPHEPSLNPYYFDVENDHNSGIFTCNDGTQIIKVINHETGIEETHYYAIVSKDITLKSDWEIASIA